MLKSPNFSIIRRWKSNKQSWSTTNRRKTVTDRVLENFDGFYGTVFGLKWNNMRAGLLSQKKYIAVVNNFGDIEKTCSILEMSGAINVQSLCTIAKERTTIENKVQVKTEASDSLHNRLANILQRQKEKENLSIYPDTKTQRRTVDSLDKFLKDANNDLNCSAILPDIERRIVDDETRFAGFYNYVPGTQIKGMEDWIPESNYYKYYQATGDFPLKIELERELAYPDNICLYTYEMGNCSMFKKPFRCLTGVLSHYLMDGSSILPPLMLDIQPGDRVLDACAAPGGKSLFMLQTMNPELLVCNDVQGSRVNRIRKVMNEYLIDFSHTWEGKRCILTQWDSRFIEDHELYDKILVDVPCTNDRNSLKINDNNIFKSSRIKERLRIPELQIGILKNCIRLLKPGGSLIYSTCSLSPIQNDGVVHLAMQEVFQEFGISVTVKDLSSVIKSYVDVFKFADSQSLKYGQMAVPFLPANFGPTYFCKIQRN